MRTISVDTVLPASAEAVFGAVMTTPTFVHVTRGALRFPAAERSTADFAVGSQLSGWIFLFGVIPLGPHHITCTAIEPHGSPKRLSSVEHGGLVKVWNHDIEVTALDDAHCSYLDRIDIDAGVLTPVVVAFAHVFYRYRQRRWRSLASVLGAVDADRNTRSS